MFRLKEVTDNSWLVQGDDNSYLGLLSEYNEQLTLIIQDADRNRATFASREEAEEMLGQGIFDNTITVEERNKESYVNGYPVNYSEPHQIDSGDTDLPLYTKTPTSKVPYCAGHYIIHFPKNPLTAYCPKLATIEEHGFDGPFKTEMEMKTFLRQLKQNYPN